MKLPAYFDDSRYFYMQGEELTCAQSCSGVPDDVEDYARIMDAVNEVQSRGSWGLSQHKVEGSYHELCLKVLHLAVQLYGEEFPILYRGSRSKRPDSEYKIMFASPEKEVARFYGEVKEYRNIFGLKTHSNLKSVKSGDWSEIDIEVIFFPK